MGYYVVTVIACDSYDLQGCAEDEVTANGSTEQAKAVKAEAIERGWARSGNSWFCPACVAEAAR